MGVEGIMEGQQHQQPSTAANGLHGNQPKTPLLSSAASQASLSPSEVCPSEAELSPASSSVSLTSSLSRPPSASPHPPATAVDASTDRDQQLSPHLSNGGTTPLSSSSRVTSPAPDLRDASSLTSSAATHSDGEADLQEEPISLQDGQAFQQDGQVFRQEGLDGQPHGPTALQEGPFSLQEVTESGEQQATDRGGGGGGSDAEEEYFEEYHLPNTHENAFVRHRSFRRKVELTPINAPDAEKIEGLVRTGEFERHGSMRRKIVPNIDLYKVDEIESTDSDVQTPLREVRVQEFKKDFREIEKLMDGEGNDGDELDDEDDGNGDSSGKSPNLDTTPRLLMRGSNVYTSTPAGYASTADYASIDLSASLHSGSVRDPSVSEDRGPESLSIEQSTMNKVRDCMDFSKCKDIYNLSGKLQDLLTPIEVEEVLNNSHRYIDFIDTGVLEALFTSVTEQMSLTGQPLSISFSRKDASSKAKTPEKELTPEEAQLQYQIKQKLLMEELALDSLPYISNGPNGGPPEEAPVLEDEDIPVVISEKKEDPGPESESRFGTIEMRKSLRLRAGNNQVEVEGVFVESDFKNSKLKTISAPSIDLANTGSQDDLEDLDSSALDTSLDSVADVPLDSIGSSVPPAAAEDAASVASSCWGLAAPGTAATSSLDTASLHTDHSCPDTEAPAPSAAADPTCPVQIGPPPCETSEEGHWRSAVIGGAWKRIDMKVIEPYTKCISSGGQHCGHPVVLVSACQLPPRNTPRYSYLMDNLFLYLLSRLEQLVSEDYILVYLSGGRNISSTGPSFHWLKTAYQMIDRKLRKNLRALLVVHPTLWVRTIVALTRPFISSKFYRKLTFVYSLTELAQLIPLDQLDIPDSVKEADFQMMSREKKRNVARRSRPGDLP